MNEVEQAKSELRLATQHASRGVTEQDQADYEFWTKHDTENHTDRYGACTICAGQWREWYQARAARKAARRDSVPDGNVIYRALDTLS